MNLKPTFVSAEQPCAGSRIMFCALARKVAKSAVFDEAGQVSLLVIQKFRSVLGFKPKLVTMPGG